MDGGLGVSVRLRQGMRGTEAEGSEICNMRRRQSLKQEICRRPARTGLNGNGQDVGLHR